MKEEFLHYIWKFQKFSSPNFSTTGSEELLVLSPGQHNQNSGPDFFNAKINLNGQVWAGNVEIHLKSSDWYAHFHERDTAYENVILHVVWEHDAEIFRKDATIIPTLEIRNLVSKETLSGYYKLFSKEQKWINCEGEFATIDDFILENWLENLYIERLQKKSELLLTELKASQNHWEALLFQMLSKNFGLIVNGEAFFSMAKSIDFSVVKKCAQSQFDLESLFFGQAGLLEEKKEDGYFELLENNYNYLRHKFNLSNEAVARTKFFRLRPPNFPTLRLSQLAVLYSESQNLFSEIISIKKLDGFYSLFKKAASEYWDTHYNFGLSTLEKRKQLSKNFIDLLVINTLIPIKFCYAAQLGKDNTDELFTLASEIASEENSIISKYNMLRRVSKNSFHSQALLQLKNEYCDKNKCLQCAIGNALLKS